MIRALPQPRVRRNTRNTHRYHPPHGRRAFTGCAPECARPRDALTAHLARTWGVDRGVARELLAALEASGQARRLYPEALTRERYRGL